MLPAIVTVVGSVLAAAHGASAHFALTYPQWRANTLSKDAATKYSQWTYPCGGVDYGAGNVTDWPLDGGSLRLELHHRWALVYVNLGIGQNTTNFNVSLTPELLNATGKGTLCIPRLPVALDVENGTLASLQVVTASASGAALYNCADIRLTREAKALENCSSSGVESALVKDQAQANGSGPGSAGGNGAQGTRSGAAPALAATSAAGLATVVALACLFAGC